MWALIDPILVALSPRFQRLCAKDGRPSILPEHLLRALLLPVLHASRSERRLMEELDHNLLYRWVDGLNLEDAVWDATVFSENPDRLLLGDVADAFFREVLALAETTHCLSHEHFTVEGTLLEAWASHKSFQPVNGPPPPSDNDPSNPSVDCRSQKRSNTTHRSVSDHDTRLTRKTHNGAALPGYQARFLMQNRHGLIADTDLRAPSADAELPAAWDVLILLPRARRQRMVGVDKGYDIPDFIEEVHLLGLTPHVSPHPRRYRGQRSAIDRRRWTSRHPGGDRWLQRLNEREAKRRRSQRLSTHCEQGDQPDGLGRHTGRERWHPARLPARRLSPAFRGPKSLSSPRT